MTDATISSPAPSPPPAARVPGAPTPLPPWQLYIAVGAGAFGALLSFRPLVALLAAAAIPFLLLTSLRTKVAAYFFILPLIFWFKYQLPTTPVQIVPAAISYTMVIQIFWEMLRGRANMRLRSPYVFMAFLFAASVVILARTPLVTANHVGLTGARTYLEPFLLFPVGLVFFRTADDVKLVLKVLVISGGVVGLYMLKQLVFGFSHLEVASFQRSFNERVILEKRLFSTLSAPEVYGFVTSMLVLACIAARTAKVLPRTAAVVGLISVLGIPASGTRVALFASAPAALLFLGMLLADRRHRRLARSLLAVGLCGVIVLGAAIVATPAGNRNDALKSKNALQSTVGKLALLKRGSVDDNLGNRLQKGRQFAKFLNQHPWGAGAGIFEIFKPSQPFAVTGERVQRLPLPDYLASQGYIFQGRDYYYIGIGTELGLLPTLLYVFLMISGSALAIEAWKGNDDVAIRAILVLTASVVVLALFANLTNEAFRRPQVASYVWFLLATPVVFARPLTTRLRKPIEATVALSE